MEKFVYRQKKIFWPANSMYSARLLVEIHNKSFSLLVFDVTFNIPEYGQLKKINQNRFDLLKENDKLLRLFWRQTLSFVLTKAFSH